MEKSKYLTLGQYLEQTASRFLDKPAYYCNNTILSFDELEKKSRRLAHWFQTIAHLSEGDRIVIQLPNINEYPVAVFAALRAGLVVVNTNPMYTTREMKHQFNDCGAKAIIILDEISEKLANILDQTQIEYVITVSLHDFYDSQAENDHYSYLHPAISLVNILNSPLPEKLTPPKTQASDIAMIQYTGGTTGVSKGACLTHSNVLANVVQLKSRFGQYCDDGKEIFVCPLPLYHIYAFTVNMMFVAGIGGLNLLIQKPQNPNEFIEAMLKFPFTGLSGINTLFVNLCQNDAFKKLDFSHLKVTLSGGSTLTSAAASIWQQTTGVTITEGYGLSETAPVVAFNRPGKEEIGTVGHPMLDTNIHIIDAQGNNLPNGQEGELVVQGPQVMLGYWQREAETKATFTADGFFKTGDVGVIQPSGTVKIVDRLKDMILVSGFNVYPNEVENVLTNHHAITEAAVVGKPCDKTGESVWAYVITSSEVTLDEITPHCKDQLTSYKVPKHITIVDSLPKSTVGKILRRELRNN